MLKLTHYFPITDPTLIFFVVLCIILLAPMVMSRLRIPHIIGMVLAGVLVGRYGLNILERDSSFELFGKVGLLYIMFLAGLEMNLTDIMKRRNKFLIFGLLTFLIPFITAYFVGTRLLGYSDIGSLLFACILSSNTLIAYPIVCKYGLQKHRSVALSVGSSMIALTLSLLIMAAIVGASGGGHGVMFFVTFILKVAVFCTLMTMLVPRMTRWFFRHYADSVMLYIYIMCVLFFSAAVSETCGLEGIFGAFLAGLILNRFIPSVSPLMNRIEFIGNALFIPYFLIGVGMLIDITVLFRGFDTMWVVICMVFFATLTKAVAAYTSCLIFRYSWLGGHMMFGLTEAHAAGGIAMTMVGMRMMQPDGTPVVDANMLNGVVMMILFTCVISSIVVENSAQGILLREKMHPEEPDQRQLDDEKMLLPLQHADDADHLVQLAILMRNKKLGRGLLGINVVYDDVNSRRNKTVGSRILEHAAATAAAADVRMITQSRLSTNISNGIKHAFKEYDASEIIMGLHRKTSPGDTFWGAYTQGLIAEISRQIMVCRIEKPLNTIRRIQVAVPSRVEYEPGFYRWIEHLARLADNLGCRMVFHGRKATSELIAQYIQNRHPEVRAEYEEMTHWKELTAMARNVHDDHLLVVVTARSGTVSYKAAFEHLPAELTEAFPKGSLIILYPDQYGPAQDVMTFTAPRLQEKESAYATLLNLWERFRS
ncbi:MAG: cation:proton antiporter [Prevotella sp.]|nr:cation:proton antiporter [Prevotella sp.]